MSNITRFVLACATLLCIVSAVSASAPPLMNYQGRLTSADGQPLAGTYSVKFALYGEPSGGTPFWQETHSITTNEHGLFTIVLGNTSTIWFFQFDDVSTYMGLQVGADPEISPRTRLTTAPYAFHVATIMGASGGAISGITTCSGGMQAGGQVNSFASVSGNHTSASQSANKGLYGKADNSAYANYGVMAEAWDANGSINSAAVYGIGHSKFGGLIWAAYLDGWVNVTGNFYAGAKFFRIDDPTDPANNTLTHACVESNEYKNVYDGVVTTDANGDATVALPGWFSALNGDFRYQLTCIGQFAQAIISEKITGNEFSIRTDKPNVEVSWQVTGVRKDAFAAAHPIEVQKAKPAEMRGKYLHPVEHGMEEKLGVDHAVRAATAQGAASVGSSLDQTE